MTEYVWVRTCGCVASDGRDRRIVTVRTTRSPPGDRVLVWVPAAHVSPDERLVRAERCPGRDCRELHVVLADLDDALRCDVRRRVAVRAEDLVPYSSLEDL